jgi:hypothetical protein
MGKQVINLKNHLVKAESTQHFLQGRLETNY